MKKTVAKSLLANGLRTLAGRSFAELASMIGHDEIKTVIGESGVSYQMERNVFCDSKPGENMRLMGSIDDGGLQSTTYRVLRHETG